MTATAIIPRRIIQTARSRNLAPLARAAATNLQLLHPDWEYLFFDDADIQRFITREFPEYEDTFASFPRNIQRIDFFRYLAVWRLGGFYFDLDVFLSQNLEKLLAESCVFPFEELTLNQFLREEKGIDWEIGNYAFGAVPNHPFLQAAIENCVRAQNDPAWVAPMMRHIPTPFRAEFNVLNTTGPGLITRTLAENSALAGTVTVLFPENVCDEQSWHQFGEFGVHAMEGSWRDRGSFLQRKLALLWEGRARKRLLIDSQRLGPTRQLAVASLA